MHAVEADTLHTAALTVFAERVIMTLDGTKDAVDEATERNVRRTNRYRKESDKRTRRRKTARTKSFRE